MKACLALKEKHQNENDYKYPEECSRVVDQRAGFDAKALRWNDYYDRHDKKYLIPFKMDSNDGDFRHYLQLKITKVNDVWKNNRVPLELVFWTQQDAMGDFNNNLKLMDRDFGYKTESRLRIRVRQNRRWLLLSKKARES